MPVALGIGLCSALIGVILAAQYLSAGTDQLRGLTASRMGIILSFTEALSRKGAPCPAGFDELLDALFSGHSANRERYATDAWGSPYHVESVRTPPHSEFVLFRIRSRGPDRVLFSADDIVEETTIHWGAR